MEIISRGRRAGKTADSLREINARQALKDI